MTASADTLRAGVHHVASVRRRAHAETSNKHGTCAAAPAERLMEHLKFEDPLETLCDELHVRPGARRNAAQQRGNLAVHRPAHHSARSRLHGRAVRRVCRLGATAPLAYGVAHASVPRCTGSMGCQTDATQVENRHCAQQSALLAKPRNELQRSDTASMMYKASNVQLWERHSTIQEPEAALEDLALVSCP